MSHAKRIENAVASLRKVISESSDEALTQGLTEALILVEQGIPDLVNALSTTIGALDDASSITDRDESEDYAYQEELESGRAAIARLDGFSYERSNSNFTLQRFTRVIEVGEGDARRAYINLLNDGHDAVMAEVVVYGMAEGFSRAAGNEDGDYMRFHEYLHKNVGADLPEGLDMYSLYKAAAEVANGDDMNGFSVAEMEEFALQKGQELYRSLVPDSSDSPSM